MSNILKRMAGTILFLAPSLVFAITVPSTGGGLYGGSLLELIDLITKTALSIAGAIAILFIIVGGIQYITAQGEDAAGAAKSRILNAIIGLVIILLAYAITSYLVGLLKGAG